MNQVPNPSEFGVACFDDSNHIYKIIEKSKNPPSDYAVIGIYMFRSKVFQAVEEIKPSHRNLYEITDTIQWLIDNNYKVKSAFVQDWWKDTGKPEDILHANRLVIDAIESKNLGISEGADIRGRVRIDNETKINSNCSIKGPVIIGSNCQITNSYIGPYTSIGNNCIIENTEIEDSILMEDTIIRNGGRIIDSLIGKGVKIVKHERVPTGRQFIIGDNSEVHL